MTEQVVYVRATRAAVRQAVAAIPATARAGGATADALMVRLGMTALGRIRAAFIVKARGGTDEAGDKWKPLSPYTVAYSRRHPGVPPAAQRAASRPSWALTARQRGRWWDLYRRGLAMYRGDKGHAARRAWFIIKEEGATTLFDKYGGTTVDILRDTGLLLNSLSPGVATGEQVFRVGHGEVIVGTNRKWAGVHHRGSRNGRIPQRRLWPEPGRWPSSWWLDILDQGRQGLVDVAIHLLGGIK
jgi:hypothetical protein